MVNSLSVAMRTYGQDAQVCALARSRCRKLIQTLRYNRFMLIEIASALRKKKSPLALFN